jgi:putative ABC transport system substrate-binding protein
MTGRGRTRRRFLAAAGAATAWPLVTRGEAAMPVIGFLNAVAREAVEHLVASFRRGLAEMSFEEGKNVVIEFRWADGRYDRLPALAAELVQRSVAVIVAGGGPPSAVAAKAATTTIPIVFTAVADPRKAGLVATLNRPGGNITGISVLTEELDSKRFELLCELMPTAGLVAILANPDRPGSDRQISDVGSSAGALGRRLVVLRASDERGIDLGFEALRQSRAGALLVLADPYFNSRREQIVALAARHRVAAMYQWREFAAAGGLTSYGPSLAEAYRQSAHYTARILKGEKPADLPVLQPTKFEFVINTKTARALGLAIPDALLARADEVIE